jgi:hypothetical protein
MDEEIDEEYQVPFKHKKKKHHAKEGNGSAKGLAEKPDVEVAEEEVPPTPAQLAAESLDGGEGGPLQQVGSFSTKKLRRKLAEYTEEYQFLSPDISHAAVARRIELWRLQRVLQDILDAREEIVEVTVPRSPMGHPYVVGPRSFEPGVYKLRASVASYLLWLIGESQRVELQRLQQNSKNIDLGTIGERAKQIHAAITRE